ncbi:FAD-binding oxidoreductase [Limnohabitans sp. Rim8]|uniref:NAD(P)/FAD-dependent oxidoreductase n=1 Tax=Limnohabitans sp. Rim8 TaxID=1100718 RepID=UPI0025E5F54A|nr:FAD-binding oxidoreductase [Limnohabitans sp. Rim8]
MSHADVVIVGSGVMGAATAYWLTRLQPGLRVTLVESDTRYEKASSSLSASSIRQQFTCPVNIRLSQFGITFLREAEPYLGLPDHPVALGLQEPGYLYLAQPEQAAELQNAHHIQKQAGADVALLGPKALRQRYPWLNVDDVALGSLGLSGEGWFDGPALHQAFLKKAMAQGVQRLHDRVVGLDHANSQVSAVRLASGGSLGCAQVVNAAGAWAGEVAAMVGVQLPIEAARRTVFVLSCPEPLPHCPLLIDPSGWWLRPEGRFLISGAEPLQTAPGLPLEPDWAEWSDAQWASLAHRIPALSALRVERAWAGYYEMNTFDHNAVIGPHPDWRNLYFINGFSGHGMQHAPGAGLALAEWMLHGESKTIAVDDLGFERLVQNRPLRELQVIG